MQGPSTQLAAACKAAAAAITGKQRQQRIRHGSGSDPAQREGGDQPLRARRIDQRAARHLADQRDDAAEREHQPDVGLGPLL
jgi:hypothetical protein